MAELVSYVGYFLAIISMTCVGIVVISYTIWFIRWLFSK